MYRQQQAGYPGQYTPPGYPPAHQPYGHNGLGQYTGHEPMYAPQQHHYHPGGPPAPYHQQQPGPGPYTGLAGYPPPTAVPYHQSVPQLPQWEEQYSPAPQANKRGRPDEPQQQAHISIPPSTHHHHHQHHQQQHHHQQQQQQQQQPPSKKQQSSTAPQPSQALPRPLPAANQQPRNPAAAWYHQLSLETAALAAALRPTRAEQQQRQAMLDALRRCVAEALGDRRIECVNFGSFASGLSLHSSDLDVALTGVHTPDGPRGGYLDSTKLKLASKLRRVEAVADNDPTLEVATSRLVPKARIPVLKLQLCCALELDISFNDKGGQAASKFVDTYCGRLPYLADMVLLLKVVLRQRGLHEVFNGGLGSWSLTNMVIAHLLEVEKACGGNWALHTLGAAVEGFLRRYGRDFDYETQAVSVRHGGFVGRGAVIQRLAAMGITDDRGWQQVLLLEDPLSGREVAGGSHCMADVRVLFRRLADRLEQDRQYASTAAGADALQEARTAHAARMAAAGGGGQQGGGGGGAGDIVRVLGTDYEVLPMLLDVAKAVERAPRVERPAGRGLRHGYGHGRR